MGGLRGCLKWEGDSAIAAANPSSLLTNATSGCADEHRAVLEALPQKDWLGQVEQVVGGIVALTCLCCAFHQTFSSASRDDWQRVCVLSLTEYGSAVSSTWAMQ